MNPDYTSTAVDARSATLTLEHLITKHSAIPAFGVSERGSAADRRSLFAAAGFDWPENTVPESVHSRQTDYPYSVDIGGGQLVAALDRVGQARRVVVAVGESDVRGATISGVYTHKEVLYWEGIIGWQVLVDGQPCEPLMGHRFLGGALPLFTGTRDDIEISALVGAPRQPDDGPWIGAWLRIRNTATSARRIEVREKVHLKEGDPNLLSMTLTQADGGEVDGVDLEAGQATEFVIRISFGGKSAAAVDDTLNGLTEEVDARRRLIGDLKIYEDDWYGGQLGRLVELARQSGLNLPDGRSIGSFWGSNANPIPDVWFRDFAYTTFAMVEFDSRQAEQSLGHLIKYAIPDVAWEREAEVNPAAKGVEHSLGNACLPAVVADRLVTVNGRQAIASVETALSKYLVHLTDQLFALRQHPDQLFATLYISDGPSRGDFHTGSNIVAWAALAACAGSFADLVGADRAQKAGQLASELRQTIQSRCVAELGTHGRGYVEGIYADGRRVAVHDGEESDLTLASYYGFAQRDDPSVINHARWSWSAENAYYAATTGGVDFWDWDDYNGVTYPAHAHLLSGASDPASLLHALDVIRRTTDADGSVWWWPFAHGEIDASKVKRGLGKCGWVAGVLVARLMHDVYGIRRDWSRSSLTLAPYLPWAGFHWQALPFGDGNVDIDVAQSEDHVRLELTNNTSRTLRVCLEAPVPRGAMIEDIRFRGGNARYQSEVVHSFGNAAVRMADDLGPGESVDLVVSLRRAKPCAART